MDLIVLVLMLALVGCAVWAITTYIPMPPIFKTAITIIVVVVLILYLLRRFGGGLPNVLAVALCVLLAGCASTGTAKPQVIVTPDDDLVVQVEARCWRVTAIDYDREHTAPDDLAYGTVVEVPCPVRRSTR